MEVPNASSQAVHNVMIANKSTDTKPELIVRGILRTSGFPGYRLHWRIDEDEGRYICRPDISFPGRKIAVFVHGCFQISWTILSQGIMTAPLSQTWNG